MRDRFNRRQRVISGDDAIISPFAFSSLNTSCRLAARRRDVGLSARARPPPSGLIAQSGRATSHRGITERYIAGLLVWQRRRRLTNPRRVSSFPRTGSAIGAPELTVGTAGKYRLIPKGDAALCAASAGRLARRQQIRTFIRHPVPARTAWVDRVAGARLADLVDRRVPSHSEGVHA